MPVLDSHVFDITRAIQLAVAPVFLLTAIGTLINALMGRLGRAVDRRRKLEELLSAFEGETRASMERELAILALRIRLVLWAMGFAVLSALLVCLLIGTAFLGAFVALDLSRPVAAHVRARDRGPDRMPARVPARGSPRRHGGPGAVHRLEIPLSPGSGSGSRGLPLPWERVGREGARASPRVARR